MPIPAAQPAASPHPPCSSPSLPLPHPPILPQLGFLKKKCWGHSCNQVYVAFCLWYAGPSPPFWFSASFASPALLDRCFLDHGTYAPKTGLLDMARVQALDNLGILHGSILAPGERFWVRGLSLDLCNLGDECGLGWGVHRNLWK